MHARHLVGRLITTVYIAIDVALLATIFFLPIKYYPQASVNFDRYFGIYAFWITATIFFCRSLNLYMTERTLTVFREMRRVARAMVYSTLCTALILFFFKLHFFSRVTLIFNFFVATVLLITWRFVKRLVVYHLVSRGFNNVNVLVVGVSRLAKQYAQRLIDNPHLGLRVVGFLSDIPLTESKLLDRPILGAIQDAGAIIQKHFVERIIVASHASRQAISRLMDLGRMYNASVQVVPDHFDLDYSNVNLRYIDELPLIEYHELKPNYQMIVFKRILDVTLSGLGLVLLLPFFLLLVLLVKLDSSGPALYASKRWGLKGRLFNCYKFRSMVVGAHELQESLRSLNEVEGPVFKIKNDPRITRVGRFLRKYSLDELPQLWNVFKGDMSIVGPRPLPEYERVDDVKLSYLRRLLIKPGLTCLWQVRGRSTVKFNRWMRWDTFYVRRWSPLLDLRIILWTIPAVLRGRGAY